MKKILLLLFLCLLIIQSNAQTDYKQKLRDSLHCDPYPCDSLVHLLHCQENILKLVKENVKLKEMLAKQEKSILAKDSLLKQEKKK